MPRPIIRHTPSDAQKRATRNAPHQIRIIGGEWKRTPLHVVDLEGLRPTPDRVRETLFNWLGQDMSGQTCLDLFAGSGALGFEAASRGAARVVMVERDGRAAQQLRATQDKLAARTVEVAQADALRLAAGLRPGTFDVIFLDPRSRAICWRVPWRSVCHSSTQAVLSTWRPHCRSRAWPRMSPKTLRCVAARYFRRCRIGR